MPSGTQVLAVSVDPPEEGLKLRERVRRDCEEDRPHIPLEPFPVRFITDPEGQLIRAIGAGNEGHWSGFISYPVTFLVDAEGVVRWRYVGTGGAGDRASTVAVAALAEAVSRGEAPNELGD
jgi:alkyl hydroperoxide reductase subunit AhpC